MCFVNLTVKDDSRVVMAAAAVMLVFNALSNRERFLVSQGEDYFTRLPESNFLGLDWHSWKSKVGYFLYATDHDQFL